MFCPQCGNTLVEGAVFCPKCGYQIAQSAQPAQQSYYQEPQYGSQPNYQQPQYGSQPNYQQPQYGSQPFYQQPQYGSYYQQPAVKPAGGQYYNNVMKIIVIVAAGLALLYGLIYTILCDASFGETMLYLLLPMGALLAAGILAGKVPPVVLVAPIGAEALALTVDVFRYSDWYGAGRWMYYLLYLGFAALFVFLLLTRKKIFKIFALILAGLFALHEIGLAADDYFYLFRRYDVIDIIGDMFDGGRVTRYTSYWNYALFGGLGYFMLILGVKSEK